jgi:hypothetical protein
VAKDHLETVGSVDKADLDLDSFQGRSVQQILMDQARVLVDSLAAMEVVSVDKDLQDPMLRQLQVAQVEY